MQFITREQRGRRTALQYMQAAAVAIMSGLRAKPVYVMPAHQGEVRPQLPQTLYRPLVKDAEQLSIVRGNMVTG